MALKDHPLWAPPAHHEDIENVHEHVHWVELFYDLIHVVCVFLLGNFLSDNLSVSGVLVFIALSLAIFTAWAESSFFNSLYVSTDIYHRWIMTAQICTVMLMAASIPHIAGKGALYFGVAYAVNRAITGFMYHRVKRKQVGSRQLSHEMSRNFYVAAAVFLIAAFLPSPYNYCLFGLCLFGMQVSYLHDQWGTMRLERFTPRLGHLAERFALLFLIVMGEGFFKLVITLSEKGAYKAGPEILSNFFLGGISVFALTWLYFDTVGNARPRLDSKWTMARWWYSHLIILVAAIMIGVALKAEVKVGFFESYPFKYGATGTVGLIVFIACLGVIIDATESKIADQFYTREVQLIGIGLAVLTLISVSFVPAIVGNTLFGMAVFSQLIIPMMRATRAIRAEEI